MALGKPCIIEHCPNMGRARSPVCSQCSHNFYYWEKKGPDAILHRQNVLEKWQDRMTYLGTRDKEYANIARKVAARRKDGIKAFAEAY